MSHPLGGLHADGAGPSMSVVITTYNRRDGLEAVLRPLLADPGADEVVVVVDGCRDGSIELLQSMATEYPRLRPVMAEPNRGQPKARLLGVQEATGDLVLCMDDDVVAEVGLAAGHKAAHRDDRGRVVLGYMPTALPAVRARDDFATREYAKVYEDHCAEYERNPDYVLLYLWGGNFSLRRDDFLAAAEGYDFPIAYHEDRDLGLRFMHLGLHGVFHRNLRARHFHTRAYESYLRVARSSGHDARLLHAMHGDVLGEFPPDDSLPEYKLSVRLLARASDLPPLRRAIVGSLTAAVRLTGRLGSYDLEFRLARVAKVIEFRRGAREAEEEAFARQRVSSTAQ